MEWREVAAILGQLLDEFHDNPAQLVRVILAMGQLTVTDQAARIEQLLAYPNAHVNLAAIKALGQMGRYSSMARIEPYLDGADPSRRQAAILPFPKFGRREVVPKLRRAAADDPDLAAIVDHRIRLIAAMEAGDSVAAADVGLETEEYEDLLPYFTLFVRHLAVVVRQPEHG